MEEIRLSLPTPIDTVTFEGIDFFLKRDDLIHPDFSGNKARKLFFYLVNDFPIIKKIVSCGSNQSNAMYSLSVLARIKRWQFEYYTDHISQYLFENPEGNYKGALDNGMCVVCGGMEVEKMTTETLFVNEGGRDKEAYLGVQILADELIEQSKEYGYEKIFLPSGTGTTALFLQKSLKEKNSKIKVYTTPCAGDSKYLLRQFGELESDSSCYPHILSLQKKYHFGKLYRELYIIWLKLQQQTNVTFDLLYDPIGWSVMMDNLDIFSTKTLYIHQGGLLGNVTMEKRYARKYKDENEDN